MILTFVLMIRHKRVAFFVFISGTFSVLLPEGGDTFVCHGVYVVIN
jgi:hypothetical protein